jgi:non-haem dioxygenase in morphine synthesis N-terminal
MFIYRFKVLVRTTVFKRNLSKPSASFSIPVVNFAKFRTTSSLEEKKETAVEIVSAFKECGFVYLSNHGISPCERV